MAGSTDSAEYLVCQLRRNGTHWCATAVESGGAYTERGDCFTDVPWKNATGTADAGSYAACGGQKRGWRWRKYTRRAKELEVAPDAGCTGIDHTLCVQY